MRIVSSGKTLAVVNVLVGVLATFGGVQEAVGHWEEQWVNVIVGSLGAAAGIAFFVSGLALWKQRSYARVLTAISCAAMIMVHVAASQFGFLGVLAILLAILYPALVLLSLWRTRRQTRAANPRDAASTRNDRTGGFLKCAAVSDTV